MSPLSSLDPASAIWREAAACPGAEPVIENRKDGSLLVLVPGGTFLAGGGGEYEGKGAPFAVELPAFYVGLTCVTNAQYGRFVKTTGHRAPDRMHWQEPEKAEHPVTYVSWDDAHDYCEWAGLRLPGELEWEKAARGADGREHPWGQEWDESRCRNYNNQSKENTADVWGYAGGASPAGCLQMAGNVWEWCEDSWESEAYDRYKNGDFKPPSETGRHVVRGGSWNDNTFAHFRCAYRRVYVPDSRGTCGFRLARSVS